MEKREVGNRSSQAGRQERTGGQMRRQTKAEPGTKRFGEERKWNEKSDRDFKVGKKQENQGKREFKGGKTVDRKGFGGKREEGSTGDFERKVGGEGRAARDGKPAREMKTARNGKPAREMKAARDGRFGRETELTGGVKPARGTKPTREIRAVRGFKETREEKGISELKETDRGRMSERNGGNKNAGRRKSPCPVYEQCGGCQLLHLSYKEQLAKKQKMMEELLKGICPVRPIIGMKNPLHYRNKVHAVFGHDRKGNPLSGVYKEGTHILVPVESCLIEDEKADEIIGTIRGMLKSFKIRTYDEDTGYGFLRHVLVRRGFATGEIMVVLVTASPVFPSKNNFVKALREKHPEITTIVQNINNRNTSMVLGNKEHVLYGKGYIEDVLCGLRFRISSKSFYQVNPVQTEVLYNKALELAGLTGKERVLDAYCGIGTIGLIASRKAGEVIGVELNSDAVRDAVQNAKMNDVRNIQFYCNDAGRFMVNMAEKGETVDVVLMDPPRSGSTKEFIDAVAKMGPKRVVYVSCGPETLARDLRMFGGKGYRAVEAWPVDMFGGTGHVETVVLMSRVDK